jgi:hypothetical protein
MTGHAAAPNAGTAAPPAVVETPASQPVADGVSSEIFVLAGSFTPSTAGDVSVSSATTSATASVSSAADDLLLLDLALTDLDDADYSADDALFGDGQDEEVHASDLALAAVLNEESDWWDGV